MLLWFLFAPTLCFLISVGSPQGRKSMPTSLYLNGFADLTHPPASYSETSSVEKQTSFHTPLTFPSFSPLPTFLG